MKRKKLSILLITVAFLLVNVSCHNLNDVTISNLEEFPDKYQRVTDNINIDVDIAIDEDAEQILYSSKAKRIKINEAKMTEELLENEEKIDQWTYKDKNGRTFSINKDAIAFLSNSESCKVVQNEIEEVSLSKGTDIFREGKTSKLSSNNLKMDDLLISWGIDGFELYNRFEEDKSKEEWNVWCGYEKWQGIYVFSNKYYAGLSEEEAPLQIIEINDKIEKIQLLYGYNFVKGNDIIKFQTFDKIADSIEKEYSLMISDNKYEAIRAELAFLVKDVHDQSDLDMEPVWVVTIREHGEDKETDCLEYQEVYSAVTARNIG